MRNSKQFTLLSAVFACMLLVTATVSAKTVKEKPIHGKESPSIIHRAPASTAADTAVAEFAVSKEAVYALEPVTFLDRSVHATTWEWTFAGGTPATSTDQYPVVTYNSVGTYTVSLTINKGTANEQTVTKPNFITATQKTGETVEIGAGGGVAASWPLGGGSYRQTASMSIYTAKDINHPGGGIIDAISWFSNTASATERTITVYIEETSDTIISSTPAWSTVAPTLPSSSYTSSTTWTSTAGWNTIWLNTPFNYNGTSNLKVTVCVMGTTTGLLSTNCKYTYKPYTHARWSSGNANPMTGTGALEHNRPNIQFLFNGHQAAMPVADFALSNDKLTYLENFDKINVLPFGWETENRAGRNVLFDVKPTQTTGSGYNVIDSSSVYSMVFSAGINDTVDIRIKSPANKIPENANLEFHIFYKEKGTTLYAPLTLYISTDDGANWAPLWTTGPANTVTALMWYKITVDLSAYSGQDARFSWGETGKYGHPFSLDDVRIVAKANNKLNVLEGDYLQFTDKSTGPAVTWHWTLPGSETGSSAEQNPHVRYPDAGTYDVTLTVQNTEGTNTKTETQIVVVSPSSPVAGFNVSASTTFTRMANYGKYIPKGATANYIDLSTHKPQSWDWRFSGGDLSSSNMKNPAITYNSEGLFDVNLRVENTMGADSLFVPEYIQVGGTDSIWNMPANDPGDAIFNIETDVRKGYLTGQNIYKFLGYAERFENTSKGVISDVMLNLFVGTKKSEVFRVQIRTESLDHKPGAILAEVDLPVANMNASGYTKVHFPSPVAVNGTFYVTLWGFEDYTYHPTPVAIKTSQKQGTGGSAYFYDFRSNKWYAYGSKDAAQFGSPKISLNLVPVFTFTEFTVDKQALDFEAAGGTQSIAVDSNMDWEGFSTASWITVTKQGNGLSVVSTANSGGFRSAKIEIRGGGEVKTIQVSQAGAPIALSGSVNAGNATIKNLSWTATPSAEGTFYSWSNGKPLSGTYNNAAGDPIVGAVRWQPADLTMYSEAKLTAVDLFISSSASYTFKIYVGGSPVYTQALTNVELGKYNHVVLTTPVTIDLSKDLVISYLVENYRPGSNPLVYDTGTALPYKGDLISIDGGTTYYSNSDIASGQVGNWCISAVIEGMAKDTFNVYRDDVKIASTTEKMYNDTYDANKHCYKVTGALKDSETPASNALCLGESYDLAEIEALKAFLRQPCTVSGQINAQMLGISDTTVWNTNNTWTSSIAGVTWVKVSDVNRVQKIVWSSKKLAGNLVLSACTSLESLQLGYSTNTALSNKITGLDVSGCTKLTTLRCEQNPLASGTIDLSSNIDLTNLYVFGCGLTRLDISKNTKLGAIECDNNNLDTLDLRMNTVITTLFCNNNRIKTLDLSNNTKSIGLVARDNQIETISLPAAGISNLRLQNNKLKLSTLPKISNANYVYAPQDTIKGEDIYYTDGINLSSEYQTTINATASTTTFTWYDITSGSEVAVTSGITGSNGIFTLSADMAGKKLRCKMTNANFPNLTGANALLYQVNVKFDTSISDPEMKNLKVYPIPTSGKVFIENEKELIHTIQVWDLTGRLLQEINKPGVDKTSIDLSGLNKGTYFLKINGKPVKVVKE